MVEISAASVITGDEIDTVLVASPDALIAVLIEVASTALSTVRLTGSAVDPMNVNDWLPAPAATETAAVTPENGEPDTGTPVPLVNV